MTIEQIDALAEVRASPFEPAQLALRRVIRRERNIGARLDGCGPRPTQAVGWAVVAEAMLRVHRQR